MAAPRRNTRRNTARRSREEREDLPAMQDTRSPVQRERARADRARTGADAREAQRVRVEQTGNRPFTGETLGTHYLPEGYGKGPRYEILHSAVGDYRQGAIVHESHLVPHESHIQRLLDLEAIRRVDDDEDDYEDEPIDVRDIESTASPTLTEATYSDSPPTLPRTDGIDVKASDVREALQQGVGTNEPRPENPEDLQPKPSTTQGGGSSAASQEEGDDE